MAHDAVLAAEHWSRLHTRLASGPPAPPAPASAPPPAPLVERTQSHPSYWLTLVYETRPPGGDILRPDRVAFVAALEDAVAAVPGSARFCHRRPPAGIQSAAPECARWVTAASRDAGGCANATCVPPISLLSFEREIRAWFRALAELARRDPSAENATDGNNTGGSSEDLIYARLRGDVGFDDATARRLASTLANAPEAAEALADASLSDLLDLVAESGGLTRDVFGVGHPPGWFFDRAFAERAGNSQNSPNTPEEESGGVPSSSPAEERAPVHAVALRSGFEFALPLAGYDSASDRVEAQDAEYRAFARARFSEALLRPGGEWDRRAEKAGVRVLHAGGGISEDEAAEIVLGDLKFATVAFALVFACVLAYTRSAWTTCHAVGGVALAFPTAFFFFRASRASPFVSFLNALVPFVLIGIGCDDVMIMCDAFERAVRDEEKEKGGDEEASEEAEEGGGDEEASASASASAPSESARLFASSSSSSSSSSPPPPPAESQPPFPARSPACVPSEEAFAARYASASNAMLATSLTTAAAFGSNAFSYIPPVRALGVFAAMTVGANFVLVLTLLPAALLLRARRERDRRRDDEENENAGGRAPAGSSPGRRSILETILSILSAFWSGARPRRGAAGYSYARLGGAGEVELRAIEAGGASSEKAGGVGVGGDPGDVVAVGYDARKEDAAAPRGVAALHAGARPEGGRSRALSRALARFVSSRRVSILVFFAVSVSFAVVVVASRTRVAATPPPLLRADVNLQRVQHLLFDVFYTESWSNVKVVFGVKGVDRSDADPNDPSSAGAPVFDPRFDFSRASTQRAALAACDAFSALARTLRLTPGAGTPECALQAFVRDAHGGDLAAVPWGADLPAALGAWAGDRGRAWRGNLGWAGEEGASALAFFTADYYVDLHPVSSASAEIEETWRAWEAATAEANEAAATAWRREAEREEEEGKGEGNDGGRSSRARGGDPGGPPSFFQACDVWNRMGVEASVRHTAVISPPVSALVAVLVAYWATDSWRVAFAALATIASAVVLMLAALVAVGWEFGVVEELCVTLLIGGSVDYCIHLAHAYAHEGGGEPKRRRERGKDLSRAEKTSAALEHAAGTITGAALTTAASAATLLACRVEVLVKIGATIVVNTAAGYVLALVLFSALMATFGD